MDPYRRDGLLAGLGLAVLLTAAVVTGRTGALVHPGAVAGGVLGAVALELAFLRYPDRLLAVWECPGVAVAALGVALLAGALSARVTPWLPWTLVWGLLVYLALLGCLLAGLGNPLAPLARVGRREE